FKLKAIFLAAAARYGSLDLRIPSTKDDSWTYGAQEIRYFPSRSPLYRTSSKDFLKIQGF
ncbi:Hypothetical protein FKW44_013635, partial [Caligus rogercresseyi]